MDAPKYAPARMIGRKIKLVEDLATTFGSQLKRFLTARAHEVQVKSADATKARLQAEMDLVKNVRNKSPELLPMLKARLVEILEVSTATGRLAIKYKFKIKEWQHAQACAMEMFKNVSQGTSGMMKTGQQTLAKILGTVGTELHPWTDLALFLSGNLKKVAKHAKLVREALADLEKLEPGSPEYEAKLGEVAKLGGTRWSIRGMLFEIYISRWPRWQRRLDLHKLRAMAIANGLGPGWEVVTQHGDMHLVGKEGKNGFKLGWDIAVLIINRKTKTVKLHTTVQVKAEQDVSAITQIIDDYTRERLGGEMSILLDGEPQVFTIENLPPGHKTNRYIFFAGGGKLSKAHEALLARVGMRAVVIEADIGLKALDAATFQIMFAMEKLHDALLGKGLL